MLCVSNPLWSVYKPMSAYSRSVILGFLIIMACRAVGQEDAASVLKQALRDMSTRNEALPAGVPASMGWRQGPVVTMGVQPYGHVLPNWWKGARPVDWRAMLPWFTVYPVEGSEADPNDPIVEISGIDLWVRTFSERRWRRVAGGLPRWAAVYSQDAQRELKSLDAPPEGAVSVGYAVPSWGMVHGGLGQYEVPWRSTSADLSAVLVLVRHRMRPAGGLNSSVAPAGRIVVQAGLDYYPHLGSRVAELGASFVPGAGVGRFLISGSSWRCSTLLLKAADIDESELAETLPSRWC